MMVVVIVKVQVKVLLYLLLKARAAAGVVVMTLMLNVQDNFLEIIVSKSSNSWNVLEKVTELRLFQTSLL